MRQDVSDNAGAAALFRRQAMRPASDRIFGSVTVILPPSCVVALLVGLLALLLLAFVAWYVEIPQRARAAGVLMPPQGLMDIVASAPGRVGTISVSEGERVEAGELLLTVVNDQQQFARHQLQSLQAEISLLGEAHARQAAIDRHRMQTLDEQLGSLRRRLAVATNEYELQKQHVALFERRLARRQSLAGNGVLSADALDREQSTQLQARARLAAMRQSILDYEQKIATVSRSRAEAEGDSGRRDILHDLERRRLERQIARQEHLVSREVRASEAGVVARINVQPGTAVGAGQALLKVYPPYRELEAWLYLSSTKAGFLEPGQVVELRLDAYPYQMFGTRSAVVTSVSRVAIVPREVNVPLALEGPVFEVRARLDQTGIEAFDTRWILAPGTSFRADVIQRRYRLYEWLLRHVASASGAERA